MYQTFSGSGRRPRQVNLSGRSSNPFASTSTAGNPQSAIASAQQDREKRQQQRERLQASSRIQRAWRGHSSRRRTFHLWRAIWDEQEEQTATGDGTYSTPDESLVALDRLLLFYSPRSDQKDIERLEWYGRRQVATNDKLPCSEGPWPKAYLKLARACVEALRTRTNRDAGATLKVLAFAARRATFEEKDAVRYYETLMSLRNATKDALKNALLAPLQTSVLAYAGLAILLSRPLDDVMLGYLSEAVDVSKLITALQSCNVEPPKRPRERLWLLGNIICLGRKGNLRMLVPIVSKLLGYLADDVDFDAHPIDLDNETFDREVLAEVSTGFPLNTFLHSYLHSLIDQDSIRNLLAPNSTSAAAGTAQNLAGYALTLLRCFPRRADDIRMWLYLGPTYQTPSAPATQYFWAAMKSTLTFATIWKDSRAVVQLLTESVNSNAQRDDWTVILVFLELFTFIIKIMDDEEFMGTAEARRNSTISIPDVADLVTFLKNLGFTMYFNSSDIHGIDATKATSSGSLSLNRHFGFTNGDDDKEASAEARSLMLAGLPGLTMDYLKGLTTGLLRAIYERDSRRGFLSRDHWLMTNRFDMTAFIPSVVAEEERRHQVQDIEDEEEGEDMEEEDDFAMLPANARGRASALRSRQQRDRAQRKAHKKRYLESVAPRLEILQNMPFMIPFETRVEIFRQFVNLDQEKRRNGHVDPDLWRQSIMFEPHRHFDLARHHAKIRRKNEFSDAFEQFYDLGAGLKEPIQISFEDEFGLPEPGIDGGGVTKEFLTSVIKQAFDQEGNENVFFVENERHLLYPNPTVVDDIYATTKLHRQELGFPLESGSEPRPFIKDLLQKFEFLGRIIGKCLYEGILVDVAFAGFFLKKWALTGGSNSATGESGYRANINDLKELDEGLYKGLLTLKNATDDVSNFDLTFTVDDMVGPPGNKILKESPLLPYGADTPVTNENRLIYINRMSWYKLQGQSQHQTNAFLKGLASIVQPSWLSMFNQTELQTLIGGAQAEIDINDLRRNTLYGGVYSIGDDGLEHPCVQMFWKVMRDFPDADRRKVLKFVTSTPRGPLLGFNHLNPRFSIRDSGGDENRFPTTSTCVNLLKLPIYKNEDVLREKLLYAVSSGAGFDLS
ncbi:hypothetical protein MBLNU230_g4381t1 [Neophaeotheca triangularis]